MTFAIFPDFPLVTLPKSALSNSAEHVYLAGKSCIQFLQMTDALITNKKVQL